MKEIFDVSSLWRLTFSLPNVRN